MGRGRETAPDHFSPVLGRRRGAGREEEGAGPGAGVVWALRQLGLDARALIVSGRAEAPAYLLEQAGAGWGYRFEWESPCPFSQHLGLDIIELTPADLDSTDRLSPQARAAVVRVAALLRSPRDEPTSMNCLACVDFLRRYSGWHGDLGALPGMMTGLYTISAIEEAELRLAGFSPR
jgi:hypothetical protein